MDQVKTSPVRVRPTRGRPKVDWASTFAVAAYNLVRALKVIAALPRRAWSPVNSLADGRSSRPICGTRDYPRISRQ